MSARTYYGLEFGAYAVSYFPADRVDNQGEPCGFCQMDDTVNDCMVFGTSRVTGDTYSAECCGICVDRVVVDYCDASYAVEVYYLVPADVEPEIEPTDEELLTFILETLGVSDYSEEAFQSVLDDRMSGPDDNRPHPDAI